MSAPLNLTAIAQSHDREWPEHYLVAHGKNGALASFPVETPMQLRRGERVVLQTSRGLEAGEVRGAASVQQARLLGVGAGTILRPFGDADEKAQSAGEFLAQSLFETGRNLARSLGCSIEILDVDVLHEGRQATVQFVGPTTDGLDRFAAELGRACSVEVVLENLAIPEEAHGGCGKPDCGRSAGGSCSTCGSGGGCSSCGSHKVDMREYFAHLRTQMETAQRTPLV
ncbi:MAG: hypothetical protein HY040_12760 [Planctomycetes bacterium]|nr:hypothetical protein [Planctomycetota bacterium]